MQTKTKQTTSGHLKKKTSRGNFRAVGESGRLSDFLGRFFKIFGRISKLSVLDCLEIEFLGVWNSDFFDLGSGSRDFHFCLRKNQREIWNRAVQVRCHLVGL